MLSNNIMIIDILKKQKTSKDQKLNGEFEIRSTLVHFLYELQKEGRFVTEKDLQKIIPETESYFNNLRNAISTLKDKKIIQTDENGFIVLNAKISNQISNIDNKIFATYNKKMYSKTSNENNFDG